jgi:exonuclease SbcD
VNIAPDGTSPGIAGEAERILEGRPMRCAGIRIERPLLADPATAPERALHLFECDPEDLFALSFKMKHGFAPGPEHKAAFHSVAAEG